MKKGDPFALPWYETEQDYLAVVSMLPASEGENPISYDAFMVKIKNAEQGAKGSGLVPIRVPIDAVTLKGWCDANNLPVCRQSISEYITISAALIVNRNQTNN